MAKRKAAKNDLGAPKRVANAGPALGNAANHGVEPVLIALAEQLGSFLGRLQKKADHLLEDEAVQQQLRQVREGATQLLERVNQASASASQSATRLATAAQSAIAPKAAAMKATAAKLASAEEQKRLTSRAPVAAPGKKHRQPPPQEKVGRRASESKAMLMGQKGIKGRMQRGGSSQ